MSSGTTYESAGVNISAGEEFVRRIKPLVKGTHTSGVLGNYGHFGGFFQPDWSQYREPVLVSSVDGVGTKLKIAQELDTFHTVGQDLVNHCVNDILVGGAHPLFFLDYFATGKLVVDNAAEIVRGFSIACKENACALIGGETAEMPGLYQGSDFDLAGTIIGVVERTRIIDGRAIHAGDRLIGLPASGLHTNGYSLVRRIVADTDLNWNTVLPDGRSLGEAMLAIHKSYLPLVEPLLNRDLLHGMVHVTGGGIYGNSQRVMPEGLQIQVNEDAWEIPAVFRIIQEAGQVETAEMFHVFNMGIGFIMIVAADRQAELITHLEEMKSPYIELGQVVTTP